MKTTKLIHTITSILMAAMVFTACEKDAHENEYPLNDGQAAVFVGLESSKAVNSLSVFVFDADGVPTLRKDYTDPRTPALEHLTIPTGSHTIVAVANIAANELPARNSKADNHTEEATLSDLAIWLKEHETDYPKMMTASIQEVLNPGEIKRLKLPLKDGVAGINITDVKLKLTLPGLDMPAYTTRGSVAESPNLRLTAEVYKKGTETCIYRRIQLCTQQTDGTFEASLPLIPGEYDLRLWSDWSLNGTDNNQYYITDNLNAVTLNTEDYVAGEQTDSKDAHYATISVNTNGEDMQTDVVMKRPFARYRLVATDVKGYLNLIEKGENLPPIKDLEVRICYEGFFPNTFNVVTGKPNDALTGICYTSSIMDTEGYDHTKAQQVGGDFVLTNNKESFVSVTVSMIDKQSGNEVSRVSGVKIPCRRGELTTVTGNFLTAGRTSSGVTIDTDWGEDIVIEF